MGIVYGAVVANARMSGLLQTAANVKRTVFIEEGKTAW
jgi:hypothetical protein